MAGYFGTTVYDPTRQVARETPNMAPPTPKPAPAPTPNVYQKPATQPKPQVATEGPTMMGQPAASPTDLRSQVFNPTASGSTQAAQNMTSGLASRLMNYQMPTFQAINPANYAAARGYLGQAAGQLGGMSIGQYGDIPVNSFQQSYGLLGQAEQALPDSFQRIAGGSYDPSQDTTQSRAMLMAALQGAQGPDRAKLAQQDYDILEKQSEPQWQQDLRTVGQKNAALGRLGSGMVTNDLMDITAQRQRDLGLQREQLATDAAGQSLADKLAALSATSQVFGQLGGEDRANAGVNLDLRNEARGERQAGLDYGFNRENALAGLSGQYAGLDQARFGEQSQNRDFQFNRDSTAASLAAQRAGLLAGLGQTEGQFATNEFGQQQSERNAQDQYALDQFGQQAGLFGQMAGLEQQRFGQDLSNRNEQRTDREFQNTLSQEAIQNAQNQAILQDQLYGNAFDRNLRAGTAYGSLGYQGDPSNAYFTGAEQYGQQGQQAAQGAADQFQGYSYQQYLRDHPEILQGQPPRAA